MRHWWATKLWWGAKHTLCSSTMMNTMNDHVRGTVCCDIMTEQSKLQQSTSDFTFLFCFCACFMYPSVSPSPSSSLCSSAFNLLTECLSLSFSASLSAFHLPLFLFSNFRSPRLSSPPIVALQIAVNPENPLHHTVQIPSVLGLPSASING